MQVDALGLDLNLKNLVQMQPNDDMCLSHVSKLKKPFTYYGRTMSQISIVRHSTRTVTLRHSTHSTYCKTMIRRRRSIQARCRQTWAASEMQLTRLNSAENACMQDKRRACKPACDYAESNRATLRKWHACIGATNHAFLHM